MENQLAKKRKAAMDLIFRHAPLRLLYKTCISLHDHGIGHTLKQIRMKLSRWTLRNTIGYTAHGISGLYTKGELRQQREAVFPEKLTFSLIVPLYNTPRKFLQDMIASVKKQTYGDWELCLADGSDDAHGEVERLCRGYAAGDERIRYQKLDRNYGISGNSNAALAMARGEYIALLDHDDLLHPAALYVVRERIAATGADFLFTDEGVFRDGLLKTIHPHFKPDYAPDSLRGNNYICHFTVFRRALLEKTGPFRPACDGSQDFDLVLRLTEQASTIVHIPQMLYFWRAHSGSTAQSAAIKPYVVEAGMRALRDHLERVGLEGEVLDAGAPTFYRVRYKIKGQPLVSIIIPTQDHRAYLERCLRSILEKTTYPNWEIVLVENGSTEPETWAYYEELKKDSRIRVVVWDGGFNYPAINRFGIGFARGDYYLLLNNDTEIITPAWIEEMLMFAQREDVGMVGAKLYFPNETIQHSGVCVDYPGPADHYHKGWRRDDPGYLGRLLYAQDLTAVTGACMLVPKRVWEQVGGMEERFAVAYNDIDLCMRIRKAGYFVVWTPFAELYHYESVSRGYEDTPEKRARFEREAALFCSRWKQELLAGDPYYNPNFVPGRIDFNFDLPRNVRKRRNLRK